MKTHEIRPYKRLRPVRPAVNSRLDMPGQKRRAESVKSASCGAGENPVQ
ncbi:hypothetical protein HMPREF1545_02408 [Oscillibacter sp. KLE 1728]|nr:hypothetical protein HMPREF1545_02408 [Oscillibacter sp. KLE 1728]ERK62120.1 hypothetical protein HMPREF1546_02797 [Oscillibacter sp. KLE 1745]